MNKEIKKNLLTAIYYYGFHEVFDTLTQTNEDSEYHDARLDELTTAYRKAYRELAAYVGYPDDLDMLETETLM